MACLEVGLIACWLVYGWNGFKVWLGVLHYFVFSSVVCCVSCFVVVFGYRLRVMVCVLRDSAFAH